MTYRAQERAAALRQLRDCRVVRCAHDHSGFLSLAAYGLAEPSEVDGNEDAMDWRLTFEGMRAARELPMIGRNS